MDVKWNEQDKTLFCADVKRPKKITGTRLAAIFGQNAWSTPFATWCDITKVYVPPFEDTKYTLAGKTIEPKQAEYMKRSYFMRNLVTPTDIWGEDYFRKTHGDFFPEQEIFGGMWDYLLIGKDGKPSTVLEMKTTSRVEDWQTDVPEYYALQAALYAYLLGVDDVVMVCSFLKGTDYDHPEDYVPTSDNTIVYPFRISERYPNFKTEYIDEAVEWWDTHIATGLSPEYDEKKDADILKELRRTTLIFADEDPEALLEEAENLKWTIDSSEVLLYGYKKRYAEILDKFKKDSIGSFKDGIKKVDIAGSRYIWTVSESVSSEIDKKQMKEDGVLEKYSKPKTTYRITVTNKEEE